MNQQRARDPSAPRFGTRGGGSQWIRGGRGPPGSGRGGDGGRGGNVGWRGGATQRGGGGPFRNAGGRFVSGPGVTTVAPGGTRRFIPGAVAGRGAGDVNFQVGDAAVPLPPGPVRNQNQQLLPPLPPGDAGERTAAKPRNEFSPLFDESIMESFFTPPREGVRMRGTAQQLLAARRAGGQTIRQVPPIDRLDIESILDMQCRADSTNRPSTILRQDILETFFEPCDRPPLQNRFDPPRDIGDSLLDPARRGMAYGSPF